MGALPSVPRGAAIFSTEDSLPIRWWLQERRDEITFWSRAKRVALRCHAVALKKKTKKHRSRSKSGVALCHGVPPFRSLLAPFNRSFLLNRTETLATRAMADRESSVALCHGVAFKKKGERSVADRESSIALCHGMALKKKGSVEDRESGVALCHGVALKKKGSVEDRESGVALCHLSLIHI